MKYKNKHCSFVDISKHSQKFKISEYISLYIMYFLLQKILLILCEQRQACLPRVAVVVLRQETHGRQTAAVWYRRAGWAGAGPL